MLIVDAVVRDCSLDSIDAQFPKLDVAGSIPVSRSLFLNDLLQIRAPWESA
jgi:hypothetical protein